MTRPVLKAEMGPGEVVAALHDLFDRFGGASYGEAVTQSAHMLQCAYIAKKDDAPDSLIVAALLHDIGHLLHSRGERVAEDEGIDMCHERLGARFLSRHFGPDVTEPIRLHVDAKRYLCAKEAGYEAGLSEASTLSLKLQGGRMTGEACEAFEQDPYFKAAIALRRYDDWGKKPNLQVPGLSTYDDILAGLVV